MKQTVSYTTLQGKDSIAVLAIGLIPGRIALLSTSSVGDVVKGVKRSFQKGVSI